MGDFLQIRALNPFRHRAAQERLRMLCNIGTKMQTWHSVSLKFFLSECSSGEVQHVCCEMVQHVCCEMLQRGIIKDRGTRCVRGLPRVGGPTCGGNIEQTEYYSHQKYGEFRFYVINGGRLKLGRVEYLNRSVCLHRLLNSNDVIWNRNLSVLWSEMKFVWKSLLHDSN